MNDDCLVNPVTGMTIRIVEAPGSASDPLVLEATYPAKSPQPPEHLHPVQEEQFSIRAGTLTVRLRGSTSELHAGDSLRIPPGTPHSMWNASDEPCVATWRTSPALETEQFFRDVCRLAAEGRTDSRGTPGLLDLAWLVPRYWNELRVTRPPQWLQRLVFALLRPFSRSPIGGPGRS